ncbi:golgi apyrase [[Candida] railenensis]|uniref:Golgi apyrase n=1 Tax=[Candida] railenensis TaxID=45579 RepID=A0A9P0VY70_9ASCO|nr:golgi apyrase [[Candida] railenensis]
MIVPSSERFGIVIDSGSSGSRIQIYKWEDQKHVKESGSQDGVVLNSPPKITQEDGWTHKISPGISTYNNKDRKVKDLWSKHFSELMKFAENIVPKDKQAETPVFVLATAGMRLLPEDKQKLILHETCSILRQNTDFYLPNCHNFVQIIDGETEGLYGWIGLNYLMGQFNNIGKTSKDTISDSIGFMDMGGASTQIAFVPSSNEEIAKHQDDLSKVTLRNINGETQTWNVFVETWLGFGANEARRRYLNQLIYMYASTPNSNGDPTVNDPCLPKGTDLSYTFNEKDYIIHGMGDYKSCVKSIYPLLMKDMPCKDTPCLFNGIHGPKLNFNKDKFIGISEYWYTANDIFQSGGEYNFNAFNEKVKEFCESDWSTILENAEQGKYSNLDPEKFLKSACFKASWVMNILHEGFELPRLELDNVPEPSKEDEELKNELPTKHIPFKSANSVNGDELSWTLGKILLFASSQIPPTDDKDQYIGIYPSEISGKEFVPGGGSTRLQLAESDSDSDEPGYSGKAEKGLLVYLPFFLLLFIFLAWFVRKINSKKMYSGSKFKRLANLIPSKIRESAISKIPGMNGYMQMRDHEEMSYNLEEGIHNVDSSLAGNPDYEDSPHDNNSNNNNMGGDQGIRNQLSVLRTRSTANLSSNEGSPDIEEYDGASGSKNGGRYTPNFLNKPFTIPKRTPGNGLFLFQDHGSRESLQRTTSSSSIRKAKGIE